MLARVLGVRACNSGWWLTIWARASPGGPSPGATGSESLGRSFPDAAICNRAAGSRNNQQGLESQLPSRPTRRNRLFFCNIAGACGVLGGGRWYCS